jgi:hypothetical protein
MAQFEILMLVPKQHFVEADDMLEAIKQGYSIMGGYQSTGPSRVNDTERNDPFLLGAMEWKNDHD